MIKAADLAKIGQRFLGCSYSDMDCQEFIERCLADLGLYKDLPGSNAWFREMTWTGSPEECVSRFGCVPPGAFLFIVENDGREPQRYRGDGKGNASHMGLKTGTGLGAIHSSASRGMVAESNFADKTIRNGGWNRVGLWDRVDYGDRINRILTGGQSAEQGEEEDPMGTTAQVYTNSGTDVFLRAKPDTSCPIWWRVPVGTEVEVLERGDKWSRIKWGDTTGYMMSQFLIDGDQTDGGGMLMVSEAELRAIYDALGGILGLRG